jgi:hypothetical protein
MLRILDAAIGDETIRHPVLTPLYTSWSDVRASAMSLRFDAVGALPRMLTVRRLYRWTPFYAKDGRLSDSQFPGQRECGLLLW